MAYRCNTQSFGTVLAGSDLSTAQYKFVDVNSSGVVALVGTLGAACAGVLNNAPESGDPAEISYGGVEKVKLGATVASGALVTSSATGLAVTAAAGEIVHGKAIVGGDSGEVGSVLLFPNSHIVAAE